MSSKLERLKKLREQINLEVKGLENYDTTVPNLIIANHNCLMDIFCLPMSLPEEVISLISARLIYKKEMPRQQLVETYLQAMPIEAHGGKFYSNACLNVASKLLQEGHSVSIFPEGAYVEENKVYKGRTGATRILYTARAKGIKANLIPVAIDIKKTKEMLDSYEPPESKVTVSILDPINYEESYENYRASSNRELKNIYLHQPIDEGMRKIAAELEREYRDQYIVLRPKGNIIFANGETIETANAQDSRIYDRYNTELEDRVKEFIKVKKQKD